MDPREISRRARIEYDILTHVRAAIRLALDAELSSSNSHVWLERVTFMFDSLRRHLERMFTIEEIDGHLSEVERERPSLAPRVAELRSDHQRLRKIATQVHGAIHAAKPDDVAHLGQLRDQLEELLGHIEEHGKHEMEIIHEAFWHDIGGERG